MAVEISQLMGEFYSWIKVVTKTQKQSISLYLLQQEILYSKKWEQ